MIEAEAPDRFDPLAQAVELALGFGDLDLSAAGKAAVVVDKGLDLVPDPHGLDGKRNLGEVAAKPPDAAGVDPGSMPAGMVLLQDQRSQTGARQV